MLRRYRDGLIHRRPLDVVDDECIDGAFRGLQLEAELFLESAEDRWARGVGRIGAGVVGGPREVDVVSAS